jgi:hypothetical protein
MLSHLIYVSQRKPSCTDSEIQKILDSCTKNNGKAGITGVLLYTDNQFIQCLEGDYRHIIQLYNKIKTDERHKTPVLISCAPISARLFPSWQMGARQLNGEIAYITNLDASEQNLFIEILSGMKQTDLKALLLLKKFFR